MIWVMYSKRVTPSKLSFSNSLRRPQASPAPWNARRRPPPAPLSRRRYLAMAASWLQPPWIRLALPVARHLRRLASLCSLLLTVDPHQEQFTAAAFDEEEGEGLPYRWGWGACRVWSCTSAVEQFVHQIQRWHVLLIRGHLRRCRNGKSLTTVLRAYVVGSSLGCCWNDDEDAIELPSPHHYGCQSLSRLFGRRIFVFPLGSYA